MSCWREILPGLQGNKHFFQAWFWHRVNTRSRLILTKSAGSLFNSTVLSGHSEERWQDSHSCNCTCLSVSHNSVSDDVNIVQISQGQSRQEEKKNCLCFFDWWLVEKNLLPNIWLVIRLFEMCNLIRTIPSCKYTSEENRHLTNFLIMKYGSLKASWDYGVRTNKWQMIFNAKKCYIDHTIT